MALTPRRAAGLVRSGIVLLDSARVPDARVLVDRRAGMQNLQAHAEHLTNLAAIFLAKDRTAVRILARGTKLVTPLSGGEQMWSLVQPDRWLTLVR